MVVDNFKIFPNRNEKNNSSLRTLFAPMVALLVICVAGVPTVYAGEDGEKTQSEAVAYYQGGGKELSQVDGKWFTDTKSADAYGQKRTNEFVQKEGIDKGMYVLVNGVRHGSPEVLQRAQQQDIDDASSHENNVSEMSHALKEMARVREIIRQKNEKELEGDNLTDDEKKSMRAEMANGDSQVADFERDSLAMLKKPLPPPSKTYEPPKVLRSDVTASPATSTETATVTAKPESSKQLVSRGENS